MLLNPANKILQAEDTDFSTGIALATSVKQYIRDLRAEEEFCTFWDNLTPYVPVVPAKWSQQANKLLAEYVVEETTRSNTLDKVKMRRLYFSVLDHVPGEMEVIFDLGDFSLRPGVGTSFIRYFNTFIFYKNRILSLSTFHFYSSTNTNCSNKYKYTGPALAILMP